MSITERPRGLPLAEIVRTSGKGLRATVNTVQEGIRLIDRELPSELRELSRWTFARALLVEAERSGKKRDLICATRQLRQALSTKAGWRLKTASFSQTGSQGFRNFVRKTTSPTRFGLHPPRGP